MRRVSLRVRLVAAFVAGALALAGGAAARHRPSPSVAAEGGRAVDEGGAHQAPVALMPSRDRDHRHAPGTSWQAAAVAPLLAPPVAGASGITLLQTRHPLPPSILAHRPRGPPSR